MTVSELRKELVQKIDKIKDNELLEEMYRLVKDGILTEEPKHPQEKKNGSVNGKKKQSPTDETGDDDIDMWLRNMAF